METYKSLIKPDDPPCVIRERSFVYAMLLCDGSSLEEVLEKAKIIANFINPCLCRDSDK